MFFLLVLSNFILNFARNKLLLPMKQCQICSVCYKMIIFIVFLVFAFSVQNQAQVLSREANSYLAGDWLDKIHVSFHEDKVGSKYIWTIVPLDNPKSFVDRYVEVGDSLLYLHQGIRTYFSLTDNEIYLLGYETNQYRVHYFYPEVYLNFSFMPESVIEGNFEGIGIYCDKLPFKLIGHYKTSVEKQGCIITESGDTIHQVMLIHTRKTNRMLSLEGNKCLSPFIEDEFRWYASGIRYPVMYCNVLSLNERVEPLSGIVEYYPQQVQELSNGVSKNVRNSDPISNQIDGKFSYNACLIGSSIQIKCNLRRKTSLTVLLTDTKGCLYKTITQNNLFGEGYEFKLDCSTLPYGQYVLYMVTNEQTFTKNFFIK